MSVRDIPTKTVHRLSDNKWDVYITEFHPQKAIYKPHLKRTTKQQQKAKPQKQDWSQRLLKTA